MAATQGTDPTEEKFLDIVHSKHPIRADVREMLREFGTAPTPECIQPHEALEAATIEELSPERQEHVRNCERCTLVYAPFPAGYSRDAAAAARESRNKSK